MLKRMLFCALLLALALCVCSCSVLDALGIVSHTHVDADDDGACDACDEPYSDGCDEHIDADDNYRCDKCDAIICMYRSESDNSRMDLETPRDLFFALLSR